MAKYIDVESLVVAYSGHTPDDEFSKGVYFALGLLDSKPPADVVTRDCYDRILWENDVMKEQLASIGKKFGEKMDGVRPVRRGRWEDCSSGWMCSNCSWTQIRESHYCPNCGADMMGGDAE